MDIVEELRQNRESGAKRLVSEYKAGLMSLARRFYKNESDAEELVNATFAKVVANIDDYLEQSAFFAWMCQILTNEFRDSVRRKSNKVEVYPGVLPEIADEDAQEEVFSNLDHSLLRDAIETLPKEMKEAIMLHYIAEQPVPVVARFLRLPVSTVKWRLHIARKELARRLGAGVKEAARKPGVKATLIALALCALTALGAAVTAAVHAAVHDSGGSRFRATTVTGGATSPLPAVAEDGDAQQAETCDPQLSAFPVLPQGSSNLAGSPQRGAEGGAAFSKEPNMNSTTLRTIAASAAIAAATGAPLTASASPEGSGGGTITAASNSFILDTRPSPQTLAATIEIFSTQQSAFVLSVR